jgi:KaiC/GvpD/RAD55 family RecA-like ATPase
VIVSAPSYPASVLTDPRPCRHIVYPYNDVEKAINAVCLFAGSGLSRGESVVLIMADSHCEPIIGRLAKSGCDLEALLESGQLECISADAWLRKFVSNGSLDEALFKATINGVIERARASSPDRKVRIFGEMASLLFARDEVALAERLEELWNEVIESQSVSLFCTYTLLQSRYNALPDSLSKLHSHSVEALPETVEPNLRPSVSEQPA